MKAIFSGALVCLCVSAPAFGQDMPAWRGYAGNAQHIAQAPVTAQTLGQVHWKTPVDLHPEIQGGALFVHYGSPMITASNTVLLPVKTGTSNGFRIEAHSGTDGKLLWKKNTDFLFAPHDWTPSFPAHLTAQNRLYYAGAGGTVYYRDTPDLKKSKHGQIAFFGNKNYKANKSAYDQNVMIDTPITADEAGNIYFGFVATGSTPLGLKSGIARIGADGKGSWISAADAAGDGNIDRSRAELRAGDLGRSVHDLYRRSATASSAGYLLALDSKTLKQKFKTTAEGSALARRRRYIGRFLGRADGWAGWRRLLRRRCRRIGAQQPRLAAALQRRSQDDKNARIVRMGRHGVHRAGLRGAVLYRDVQLSADDKIQQLLRRRQWKRP